MAGHILIIDAMSNRRIQVQAHLDSACYQLEHAVSQLDGLSRIKADPPEVVILAHDVPGLTLSKFCQVLKRNPATQLTAVIVLVPRENHSERVSALMAGAADVVEYGVSPAELQARLRNFIRQRIAATEVLVSNAPTSNLGFAEPAPAFETSTHVAIVQDDMLPDILGARHPASLCVHYSALDQAKRGLPHVPDVVVLREPHDSHKGREALGTLRAHPNTRNAAFLYLTHGNKDDVSPLDLGAQDQVAASVTSDEVLLRIERLATQKRQADQARAELSNLGEFAYSDALTGLKNRRFADAYLARHDRTADSNPHPCAVLMADIDHFKQINDAHGHAVGDAVLKHIADILNARLRAGDMVARYGGEEFLIALLDIGANEARSVADRLCKEIAGHPMRTENNTHIRATISIGLAHSARVSSQMSKDLRRAADVALYRAKAKGRNQLQVAVADDANPTPSVVLRSRSA